MTKLTPQEIRETLAFDPWQRAQYRNGIGGVRVLIVGESHYGQDKKSKGAQFTRSMVEEAIQSGRRHGNLKFFYRVQSLFTGINGLEPAFETLKNEEHQEVKLRQEFWSRVAFCNYIQEILPNRYRRPGREAWERGFEALQIVLKNLEGENLAPQCILFASRGVHMSVKRRCNWDGQVLEFDKKRRSLLKIPVGTAHALASFVPHPSRYGYKKQRPWVEALIQRAQSLKDRAGAQEAEDFTKSERKCAISSPP